MTEAAQQARCPFGGDAPATDFDHNATTLSEESLWPAYEEMRSLGRVTRSGHHGGYYVVTGFDDVRSALRDSETFVSGHGHRIPVVGVPKAIPIDYDGTLHREYRRIMIAALTPRRIAAMQPFLRDLIGRLVADFHAAGGGDVVAQVALPLPLRVLVEVVGFSEHTVAQLRELTEAMWSVVNDVDYDEARREIRALIEEEIAGHRESPRDDFLSGLLDERVEDRPIAEDEIARTLITMAIAGHETTMNAASSLLWLLARDRDQQELLRGDPSLAPQFVEEMLRLRTPAQNFARHTAQEVAVGDTVVPEGARVLLSFAAANRDPAAFPDPDRFDVSRASRAHLAFGWGAHQCIGATLARTELKILLETLVAYPPFVLDGEATFHPLQGGIHYGPHRLPLRFED
jgi:cytochrome P450